MSSDAPIGYVLKMYPRFSETFIVSEILAREQRGERLVIFSLRPPIDPRFHRELARVNAPVIYVERPTKPSTFWAVITAAMQVDGLAEGVATALPELSRAAADDAIQAVALARLAHEYGVGHLHAHFGSLPTTVARLCARILALPYSFTAHAKDIFHEDVDERDLAVKVADAHHVVTVSDYNFTHLSERFPDAAHRLRRIYNGLELDRFPYRGPLPRRGALRIAAVGRLVEKKGFDLLVAAIAAVRDRGIRVEARIAGGGALETPLRELIRSLNLDDRVRLLGPVPQHDIVQLLADSDAFVAPCVVGADGNADGLPTVILEAMATGTYCIASDVTGIPEVIRSGETGTLVRSGDLDDLIAALVEVADPAFDRESPTVLARALIEERFDSRTQADALRSCLRDIGPAAAPCVERVSA
ncbi:glycosyltransferase [Millisia brevis]|uniref:glycosyltransferase n=1 Tax=Millisia brevis TaxID=264148 RepID=UPI00082DE492|nr:glycosyltransferase [Millisia brevis]